MFDINKICDTKYMSKKMTFTKKEKDRLWKGALVGGIAGACLGVPILGAAAGSFVNYNNKVIKRKKDNR